jgi:hypothetical protein
MPYSWRATASEPGDRIFAHHRGISGAFHRHPSGNLRTQCARQLLGKLDQQFSHSGIAWNPRASCESADFYVRQPGTNELQQSRQSSALCPLPTSVRERVHGRRPARDCRALVHPFAAGFFHRPSLHSLDSLHPIRLPCLSAIRRKGLFPAGRGPRDVRPGEAHLDRLFL